MSKFRQKLIRSTQVLFGDITLSWTLDRVETSLDDYIEKHGVFHLLEQKRMDDAEKRLFDVYFVAAFSDSWETSVEPLAVWRLLGLKKAERGYLEMANNIAHCLSPVSTPRHDVEVLQGVSVYCKGMGIYTPAEMIAEYVLGLAEACYPESDETIQDCLYQLADAKLVAGKYLEAQEYIERDIALSIKYNGAKHTSTVASRLLRLNILIFQGLYAACLAPATDLLATLEEICEPDDDMFGEVYHTLGTVLLELDRLDEAEQYFQQDFEHSQSLFGDNHFRTIAAIGMMGKLRIRQGRYEDAREYFQQTQELYIELFGLKHPKTLVSFANIATAAGELGEYERNAA